MPEATPGQAVGRRHHRKHPLLVWPEYLFLRLLVALARRLPLRLAYALSAGLGRLAFLVDRAHRNRVIRNALHAGVAADRSQAVALARRNFRHFSRLAVDIVRLGPQLTTANVGRVVAVRGAPESVARFFTPGRSEQAIIVTGHYGNWELAGLAYVRLSRRPLMTVMRPLDNPRVGRLLYGLREGQGHRLCPKEGALKSLLGALKAGESVALISDQHAGGVEGVRTLFFGQPVKSHLSPALLHLRTGVPILVAVCRRLDDTPRYEIEVGAVIEERPGPDKAADVQRVAQLYTSALEALIRQAPEQWLWAHRRWLGLDRGRSAPPRPA